MELCCAFWLIGAIILRGKAENSLRRKQKKQPSKRAWWQIRKAVLMAIAAMG
ncbi:hypothetical protein [Snodgrassella communis]|uniref:hypothetical protein n=1 Tax=Snodgrassella communis TaxID=2946699 RepID=UPI001EF6CF86|nr:hypothetical protein [Snodgrassella communis]